MVGFKGSTQEKSIFEIFRFRLKKSPHDKKVPDRVGSRLMFGGGDAVFDELFEIAKVTPQSSGKQKRFGDRTNFNREFCGATKKPLETPSEFTRRTFPLVAKESPQARRYRQSRVWVQESGLEV
jgi:hypothetical protein